MNRTKFKTMADLSFLSVPAFLHYVEGAAGLEEVSTHAIFSFRITSKGVTELVKRKKSLLFKLKVNNEKLSRWVVGANYQKDSSEMVILRSLYLTTRASIEMVEGHIETAERLVDVYTSQETPEIVGEGKSDEWYLF